MVERSRMTSLVFFGLVDPKQLALSFHPKSSHTFPALFIDPAFQKLRKDSEAMCGVRRPLATRGRRTGRWQQILVTRRITSQDAVIKFG